MENEVNEKVVKNQHGPLYWLMVILVLFIIILISITIGEKISKTKVNNENNSETSETNKTEEIVKLNDEQKNEIASKIAILVGSSNYTGGKLIKCGNLNTNKKVFQGTLNEDDKAFIITRTAKETETKINEKNVKFKNEEIQNYIYEETYPAITKNDYDTNYKKVFGSLPTNYPDRIEGCPYYDFELNSKQYFFIGGCGGASPATTEYLIYIDDYNVNNKTVTITTYVGFIYKAFGTINKTYSDLESDDYDENDLPVNKEVKASSITEENKTEFAKYNFIFEKAEDGEYYFKSTEKAN